MSFHKIAKIYFPKADCTMCYFNECDIHEFCDECDFDDATCAIILCDYHGSGICSKCYWNDYTEKDLIDHLVKKIYVIHGLSEVEKIEQKININYTWLLQKCITNLNYVKELINKNININATFHNPNFTLLGYLLWKREFNQETKDIIKILINNGYDLYHRSDDRLKYTIMDSLLYEYIDCDITGDSNDLDIIHFLINECNFDKRMIHLHSIAGIQYENRPKKINKVNKLINLGIDFNNKCISIKCIINNNHNKCKLLYDTRLGKVISSIFAK